MFEDIYEWLRSLSVYLILIEAIFHALPESEYRKYVRFFSGMVLILLILTPVFRLFGMDGSINNFYKSREYEQKIEEIERASQFLYEIEENNPAEVEEIVID